MNEQNYNYQNDSVFVQENSASKKFLANVFMWMFVALGISTFTAYLTLQTPYIFPYLIDGRGPSILGWVAIFGPIALIFFMGAAYRRFSLGALILFFAVYSILTGLMFSFVLVQYTGVSIAICFAAAASIFAVMAFMGYTTDTDLSKFGPILIAGIIGLVIVSVINMFIGSSTIEYFLGFFGVVIFTALTAYKVQAIKRMGEGIDEQGDEMAITDSKKMAIIAALSLYITFINLFMSLLRIFGGRK
jgi:FtsH-binding integral membrane protein